MPQREFIIEFHRVGNVVKVSAIDPVTMTEVSIQGPASPQAEEALEQAAVKKLLSVMKKKL